MIMTHAITLRLYAAGMAILTLLFSTSGAAEHTKTPDPKAKALLLRASENSQVVVDVVERSQVNKDLYVDIIGLRLWVEYWSIDEASQWSARLTHRIKTLYGFFNLLRYIEQPKTRKAAEASFLYLMA